MATTQKDELKTRVEAKRKELQARAKELRADSQKHGRETLEKVENKLKELDRMLRDGWDNVSETTSAKLNEWLK